tara:strand:+ start:3149 stop:4333 length:1185 start_codon:yes stop_codon:yes gene_type:complete
MKKIISILGSTGSIGKNTLKILDKNKKIFKIHTLVANSNYNLICKQIIRFKPEIFIVNNFQVFKKVKKRFEKNKVKIFNNIDFNKIRIKKSDITVAAIPGIAGLKPTIEMCKKSKRILIANKESIICGWNLIKKITSRYNTEIIPIDSEHFSIMKIIENQNAKNIKKIYLTASGGPFLKHALSRLKNVKPNEAIKHPKWKMGKKISIDSATLMNKMLESVEAEKLFSINSEKIEIIIHPESLIHAIIEFKNGLYKFIYHETTMLIPLANAIFDENIDIKKILNFKNKTKKNIFFDNLNFTNVDKKRFPVINLKPVMNRHSSSSIIINAVNEILVDQFLKKRIPFNSFYTYIQRVLNNRNFKKYAIRIPKNINQIFEIDKWARETTIETIKYENI